MHVSKHAAQLNKPIERFKKQRNINLIIDSLKTCNVRYSYHDSDLRHCLKFLLFGGYIQGGARNAIQLIVHVIHFYYYENT